MSKHTNRTTDQNPDEYQGWANYETWDTFCWISSDQANDEQARDIVYQCFERARHTRELDDPNAISTPLLNAADQLKEMVEEWRENVNDRYHPDPRKPGPLYSGLFADLLQHALDRVNWREIAEHYADK